MTRDEARAELRRFAELNPTGWAADVVAAGPVAVEAWVDRVLLWDALATLRQIDLRRRPWPAFPFRRSVVTTARAAILSLDAPLAGVIRSELHQ